ncbi:MAG TPA: tetratricopeptide repeat protein [Ignavibacteriales bacterium]|nr:tetratricopeptide repeat protein [Ignavibacteriales bacterium]
MKSIKQKWIAAVFLLLFGITITAIVYKGAHFVKGIPQSVQKPAKSMEFNSVSIELNNKALGLWQKELLKEKPNSSVAGLVISLLDSAITVDSSYYLAYGNKANILLGYGRTQEAIKTMEKCIKNRPGSVEGIDLLGMMYEFTGDKKEAINKYEQALSFYQERFKEKHDFNSRGSEIITLLQLGRKREADSLVSKLPVEFPDKNKETADFLTLYKTFNHKEEIENICRKRYK